MYYIYLLTHKRCVEHSENGDIYDTKVLGIYTTRIKAQAAIEFFVKKPGFCDYKDNFIIQKRKLLGDRQKEIRAVFLVEHERFLYDDVYRKEFLCICYDEDSANGIINAEKQKSQYAEDIDEYEVIEYDLDAHSIYWSEGFD